ncbi:MAG: hypothetical protein H6559_29350 [Lewinellaceae bacterium]|nr:hypothetical protein [Lewinellaceae bacterium]
MDWTGAGFFPTFESGYDPFLHIFGSLTLIRDMNHLFRGFLTFESQNTGNIITTANHYVNKVDFTGSGGEWTLRTALNVKPRYFFWRRHFAHQWAVCRMYGIHFRRKRQPASAGTGQYPLGDQTFPRCAERPLVH